MFSIARVFNQPLDEWNLSSVVTMNSMFDSAKEFNQCLSTWSGKTFSAIDTTNMFYDTACPSLRDGNNDAYYYGTPKSDQAPWCQTNAEQCYDPLASRAPSESPTDRAPSESPTDRAPSESPADASPSTEPKRGLCVDDSTFEKSNKNCKKFLKKKKKRSVNCLKKYKDNKLVEDFCPSFCKKEQW